LLEFAQLDHGAITLTAAGHLMAQAGTDERKKLFREQLLRFVPLVTHIRQVLNEREDHAAPRARFEFELEDHLNASDAEKTLRIAIGWGRYAELFAYDDATRGFRLVDAAH
jgi:NitT/TauT family transport system ATP-binding protein